MTKRSILLRKTLITLLTLTGLSPIHAKSVNFLNTPDTPFPILNYDTPVIQTILNLILSDHEKNLLNHVLKKQDDLQDLDRITEDTTLTEAGRMLISDDLEEFFKTLLRNSEQIKRKIGDRPIS